MSGPAYSTVLVGTDGSESSFRAVDRAAAVARDAGATLLLACAYRPMTEREIRDAAAALGDESYKVSGSTPEEDVLRDAADRAKGIGAKLWGFPRPPTSPDGSRRPSGPGDPRQPPASFLARNQPLIISPNSSGL